jgi:hypothetical protein
VLLLIVHLDSATIGTRPRRLPVSWRSSGLHTRFHCSSSLLPNQSELRGFEWSWDATVHEGSEEPNRWDSGVVRVP